MTTIKDVAKEAKVAISTVSYVLNNSKPVKPETKQRVLEAIKSVGYRHNAVAASLKSSHRGLKTIGVVGFVDKNPYFSELFFELENACYQQGYAMLSSFCRIEDGVEKVKDIPSLMHSKVDGIVFISTSAEQSKEFLKYTSSIPSVVICSELTEVDNSVNHFRLERNGYQGGVIAASYLYEQGYKSFACVTDIGRNRSAEERLDGFKSGLASKGVDPMNLQVLSTKFDYQGGYDAMIRLFSSKVRPEAVFFLNDLMAIGAINAANHLGLKMPKDIAILGYDNIHASELISPSLSTIEVSHQELSTQVVTGLIQLVIDKRKDIEVNVMPTLKIRQTT